MRSRRIGVASGWTTPECPPPREQSLRPMGIATRSTRASGTSPLRVYVYKLTVDNGGAPCVTRRLLSLAICKPNIRARACPGDWIFGFGGKDLGGRLLYIARVSERLENGSYYRDDEEARRFQGR